MAKANSVPPPQAPAAATLEVDGRAVPSWIILLLAGACGLIVANIYYAQPLAGPIGAELGLSPQATGLIVTMTQIGYAAGLLLLVPLGDLVENRRLVVAVIALGMVSLAGAAVARSAAPFLAATLLIGIGSVAVQILVPYAAHLAPEAIRGRVVGTVMSGLLLGIMLARPVASLITHLSSWRVVFVLSAVAMAATAALLARMLPERHPGGNIGYGKLLVSMLTLMVTQPILRRRALVHACLFAAFSVFWTTVPLLLAGPVYRLNQAGIAIFAFAGVAGAVAAPIAGRLADRGHSRAVGFCAMAAAAIAFLAMQVGTRGGIAGLLVLALAGIVLDAGVSANLVVSQRAIFSLGAEYRSRLNGLFLATFFFGGALGSGLGAWIYAQAGWDATVWLGFALPVVAALYFATERDASEPQPVKA